MKRMSNVSTLEKAHKALVEASALLAGQVYEYLVRDKVGEDNVPSGYIGTRRAKKQGLFKWGHRVVQYSQPLSERLKDKYRLISLSPEDPTVQKDALWSFGSDIRTTIIDDGMYEMDMGGGKMLLVDMNDDGKWTIVIQNLSGRTMGRPRVFSSLDKVLPALWEYLSERQKKPYLKKVLPNF